MKNRELFEKARSLMPGGVSSPVRAFKAVGGVLWRDKANKARNGGLEAGDEDLKNRA